MSRVSERARPIWLGAAACAAGFILVALVVASGISDPVDAAIISVVRAPELHDALSPLARITELGSTWAVIVVGALVLVLGWLSGRPRDGAAGALTIAIGSLIVEVTKRLTERMRPDFLDPVIQAVGYSFPSGHTTNATVAYGVLGSSSRGCRGRPPSAWRLMSFSVRSSSASACRGCGSGFTIRPTSLPGGSSAARSC